jgi:hypothetical protein
MYAAAGLAVSFGTGLEVVGAKFECTAISSVREDSTPLRYTRFMYFALPTTSWTLAFLRAHVWFAALRRRDVGSGI